MNKQTYISSSGFRVTDHKGRIKCELEDGQMVTFLSAKILSVHNDECVVQQGDKILGCINAGGVLDVYEWTE